MNQKWIATNLPTHSGLGEFKYLSVIQTLLMGYGVYCLISKTTKFIKKLIIGSKELPIHND